MAAALERIEMATKRQVREKDLHAYLDGELPPERASIVEAHLRECPDDARRLRAYRADGEAIARIFALVAVPAAPLPAALLSRSQGSVGTASGAGAVAADRHPTAEDAGADERTSEPIGVETSRQPTA